MVNVTEELIKTGNQIRDKYRALRKGKLAYENLRTEQWKPVVEPLKELVEESKKNPNLLQVENVLPHTPQRPLRQIGHTPRPLSPHVRRLGSLATFHLSIHMSRSNEADHTYGIRFENAAHKIGNKVIEIVDDDIIIGDIRYKGTLGLWELVTLKKPKNYTQDDLDKYKEMLIQTSAHHKSYNPDSALSANSGSKYMQIIRPLFTQTGDGIKIASDNKTEFEYWHDPNTLIDELRLLHYSQQAGNTGVSDKIQSIINTLLKNKIIYNKNE